MNSDQNHRGQQVKAMLQQALVLHQNGKLPEASTIYQEILKVQPKHFRSQHLLGVIAGQTGNYDVAVRLFGDAIKINPYEPVAYNDLGVALTYLNRLDEALANIDKAISLKSDYAEAHFHRGLALQSLNRVDDALASYDSALSLRPDYAAAYNNRGSVLQGLKRLDEAVACYDKAISLYPDFTDAYYNRGMVLNALNRPADALASYDSALSLKPDYTEAHNNRAMALSALSRWAEALASCDKALSLKPDYTEAHNNRAMALSALSRWAEALASCDKALSLKPDYAEAHSNRGRVLWNLNRLDEALASYDKALSLKPNMAFVFGTYLHIKMMLCNWNGLPHNIRQLERDISIFKRASSPAHGLLNSPELHKIAAKLFAEAAYPKSEALGPISKRTADQKIRVGYFSSDFRNHALSLLMAGVIEKHDRSRFETFGFAFGEKANDLMRKRLMAGFDRFIDVQTQSDRDVALLARRLGIDIAIDLNGFTGGRRTNIFALRAAPIQVNYLGYPGTMGADYIDYLVADHTLIPADYRQHYTEKIVYLPDTYQPNDTTRPISDRSFTRAELGLPEGGFVFCSFNNSYKITPEVFNDWMSILDEVSGSVLWLLETSALAKSNLQREAEQRGIAAERLVFAGRMELPEHLARHRLADLFLDTLPCNAHTTTSDALWAGLPVLSRLGETFAGRVAASLLKAIGLSELIVSSAQAYKELAVELATHPERLQALKRKLAANRLSTPLFDTERYVRHLEAAYVAMHARCEAGLPPDHIR